MKRARVPGTASTRVVRALFVLPDPDGPGLTPAERLALTFRRDATMTGRCVCGATAPPVRFRRGDVVVLPIEHESDCPAADGPHLERLVRRLGDGLAYSYVVVEYEVAA